MSEVWIEPKTLRILKENMPNCPNGDSMALDYHLARIQSVTRDGVIHLDELFIPKFTIRDGLK